MAAEVSKFTELTTKQKQSAIGKSNVSRGKSNERKVAKMLSTWTGEEFRRRRVEGRDSNTIDRESTSDIIPANLTSKFSIEVKCGKGFSLDALLGNYSTNILCNWWHQVSYDSEILSKHFGKKFLPMLFFKPSITTNFVVVPHIAFTNYWENIQPSIEPLNTITIRPANGVWVPSLIYDAYSWNGDVTHNIINTKNKKNKIGYTMALESCVMMRWNDFSASVDPKSIFM